MTKKYTIEHLGKTLVTDHYHPVSNAFCEDIRTSYYRKPTIYEVHKNLKSIHSGGTNMSKIVNFYFKDLMAKVKLYTPRWTIEEVLQCNELIGYYYSRIASSEKVYPKNATLIANFETALRLSGGGVAMKPSNFPMKTIDSILKKYNVNNNYYDYSCGWGVRLLSAMKNNVNYYGTDPNFELTERLLQLESDYKRINNNKNMVDIKTQGSEIIISEWCNKIGLAFSSPPYYNLEDYKIGNQSYKNGVSYNDWLQNYLKPTIENIRFYLIDTGYFLINIKDFNGYELCKDTRIIAESLGFEYIENIVLKNIIRPSAKRDLDTNEGIMVFKKSHLTKF